MKLMALSTALLIGIAATPVLAQTTASPSTSGGVTFLATQPSDQWLASFFAGEPVVNATGEVIGNVNDLLLDKSGKITTVVLGVGGFLGIGEKEVAVPYSAITIGTDKDGHRQLNLTATRDTLDRAPRFAPVEKSLLTRAGEQAKELSKKAGAKIEEMRKHEPVTKPN